VRGRGLLFFTVLFSYCYFFGGSGFNQNSTFALTRAIVERQQLHIDAYASNTADLSRYGGHFYSNKAPGLSFLAVAPYAAYVAVAGVPHTAMEQTVALYVLTAATCGLSGALLALLIALAATRRGVPAHIGNAIALVAALGTPLFAYSTMLFAHVPSALLVLVAVLRLDGTLRRSPAIAGAAIGAATVINHLCAPIAVILLATVVATSASRVRDALRYVAGGIPFGLALAAYQTAAFGAPFRTPLAAMNPAFRDEGAWLGVFAAPKLDALWGITFSPYRGLFYIAPILLAGAGGVLLMLRKRRAIAWTIVAAITVTFLFNAAFNGWFGGYTIGPRYVLHVVPLFVLGLIELWGRARLFVVVTAAVSLLFNFAVTAVDPQPPQTLRDPIGRYALPALFTGRALDDPAAPWLADLYTGHTSTNRVAADELMPFQRHRPGSKENEWASFNAGELAFGPGSAASVLPWLVAIGAVSLAWWRGRLPATHTIPDTRTARSRSA